MEFTYDAYCGLYCGACTIMLANQNGELESLAKQWEMKVDDLKCFGCKSGQVAIFCTDCEIKACAEDKQLDFCFQCDEFPCARMIEFRDDEKYPYHQVVFNSLEDIRQKGIDTWLKEQDARWSCPNCGERFAWRDEVCKHCGGAVSNYTADL
jgi:predicted RNA-binding Zn-ribbon protein involved in translation (DUF1610 family)